MIDARAIIDPSARIAEDVTIGPWSVVGADVEINSGTKISSHVIIKGPTKIGHNNQIFQFASVGEDSQDKKYHGEKTFLEIGNNNIIREYCSIHRGTVQGGSVTKIGNNNLFMAYSHVAHDCIIGNNIIFANYAAAAGHVTVDDYAILSGYAGVHQFCRLGAHSFLGVGTLVRKDVLPYVLVDGQNAAVCGLNTEGLKRRGFSADAITVLKRAYKIIFRDGLTVAQAIEQLQELNIPEINPMIVMLQQSKRGIVR